MKLAIKGHKTRFKEVKQLLKQLGGQPSGYACVGSFFYYYINKYGNIEGTTTLPQDSWDVYTLEEFEKEFPYKVGDVITYFDRNNKPIQLLIQKIRWNPTKHGGTIEYVLQNGIVTTGENLKPMKKELKDYLKPGYVVETDGGTRYIIVQDVHGNAFGIQIGKNAMCWHSLATTRSIKYVYQIDRPFGVHLEHTDTSAMTKVWERKEVELTMQEIADKFGIDVNQLKIKK